MWIAAASARSKTASPESPLIKYSYPDNTYTAPVPSSAGGATRFYPASQKRSGVDEHGGTVDLAFAPAAGAAVLFLQPPQAYLLHDGERLVEEVLLVGGHFVRPHLAAEEPGGLHELRSDAVALPLPFGFRLHDRVPRLLELLRELVRLPLLPERVGVF